MQTRKEAGYRAYMLRLWWVQSKQGRTWRASLENARTGQRRGFPDLKALFAFLQMEGEQGVVEREQKGAADDRDAA